MSRSQLVALLLVTLSGCSNRVEQKKRYTTHKRDCKDLESKSFFQEISPADFEQPLFQVSNKEKTGRTQLIDERLSGKKQHGKTSTYEYVKTQEAKLADIPIPLDTFPIDVQINETSHDVMFQYESKLSFEALKNFYLEQMEYLGWEKFAAFYHNELLFLFTKPPKRLCVVSLRSMHSGPKILINIFTGYK